MCVCVCVCARARARECVCERERERFWAYNVAFTFRQPVWLPQGEVVERERGEGDLEDLEGGRGRWGERGGGGGVGKGRNR